MIINSFPKIVKGVLRGLPKNDYPVLNSRLFFECWLSYAMDNSLTSMRDLFKRLNNTGFEVDISTFSKANLHRSQKPFQEIYLSDDEIRDIYRLRWGVELLWKFLKMHLKLDKLITKNVNGITIQIYVSLIAYLILHILSIPQQWGHTLLDKFRYLQSCMCQKISYVHWFEEMMSC
ncbi:transposase [Nostoc sp.]|uniref:transposase n=1 Tax=Nostoc sp. TaxID=1180 RepID=UPI002FFBB9FD